MNKRTYLNIFIFSLILMFFPLSARAEAEENLKITIEYGLKTMFTNNKRMPVKVKIKNNGNHDFKGKAKLSFAIGQRNFNSNMLAPDFDVASSRKYSYEEKISVKSREDYVFTKVIPYVSDLGNLSVTVFDENNVKVCSRNIIIPLRDSENSVLMGIVTDSKTSEYNSYKKIKVNENVSIPVECEIFKCSELPEEEGSLEALDLLIADKVDLGSVSLELIENMDSYLLHGGTVAVTDQDNYYYLLDELHIMDSLANRRYVYDKNPYDVNSFQVVAAGEGKIIYINTGNMDLNTWLANEKNYKDILFISLNKMRLKDLMEGFYTDYYVSSWYSNLQMALNDIRINKFSKLKIYVPLLILYIVIITFIIYRFTKLRKKSLLSYPIVIGCSLVFSAAIYMAGSSIRYTAPFINYIKVVHMNNGRTDDNIFMGIQAPYGDNYKLYMDNEYDIRPEILNRRYDYRLEGETPVFSEMTMSSKDKEYRLNFNKYMSFEGENLSAFRSDYGPEKEIYSKLDFYENRINGYIVNNTGHKLRAVVLILNNSGYFIGDLNPGERITVNNEVVTDYFNNNIDAFVNQLYGKDESKFRKNITEYEKTKAAAVLKYYIFKYNDTGNFRPMILGIMDKEGKFDLQLDSGYKASGITMVESDADVYYGKKDRFYFNDLFDITTIIEGDMFVESLTSKEGEVELDFARKIDDMKLYINNENYDEKFYEEYNDGKYKTRAGVSLFNYGTGNYDDISGENISLSGRELHKYIENNKMKIKFTNLNYNKDLDYNYCRLPRISISGRKTDFTIK